MVGEAGWDAKGNCPEGEAEGGEDPDAEPDAKAITPELAVVDLGGPPL